MSDPTSEELQRENDRLKAELAMLIERDSLRKVECDGEKPITNEIMAEIGAAIAHDKRWYNTPEEAMSRVRWNNAVVSSLLYRIYHDSDQAVMELKEAKQALSEVVAALGNGSLVSAEADMGLLKLVPREVAAEVKKYAYDKTTFLRIIRHLYHLVPLLTMDQTTRKEVEAILNAPYTKLHIQYGNPQQSALQDGPSTQKE